MTYDLNLAIAFVWALGLLSFVASWLVPRALRAMAAALSQLVQLRHGQGPKHPADDPDEPRGDWWGPTHHSQ